MTSKIKVDNINKVSDDSNIIKKCGTTVTVGAASDGVRTGADNLQAADGGNLISQSGTTITLGASGDTITLASGASQTGFGRTGTVDWQTGSIKTSTFTAANGEGYFANTSGGAFTMNLPAGTAGNIVSVVDYTNTFQTNTIDGTPVSRAGGGGGSGYGGPGGAPTPGAAGDGKAGGGNGTNNKVPQVATAGAANRGSGGGGGVDTSPAEGAGAAGGSGIVLIRYKFQ